MSFDFSPLPSPFPLGDVIFFLEPYTSIHPKHMKLGDVIFLLNNL